jgi:hypothetical protein
MTTHPGETALKEKHSHLEIALASITCFQDDGRLDLAELDKLVSIAERDGSISPDEAHVLNRIIGKLTPAELDGPMQARVAALREQLAPLL